jgi:hypothetical protein
MDQLKKELTKQIQDRVTSMKKEIVERKEEEKTFVKVNNRILAQEKVQKEQEKQEQRWEIREHIEK